MVEKGSRSLAHREFRLTRRGLFAGLSACLWPTTAHAFGQEGAFHPRMLTTGGAAWSGVRLSAPSRWSWELVRRTSAPARLVVGQVAADHPSLLAEPFVVWAGEAAVAPLSGPELRGLGRFIRLGGVLLVDDAAPSSGEFGRTARREIGRVIPDSPRVKLKARADADAGEHVVFKSYYLVDRPIGRVEGPGHLEAIVRGGSAQVIFVDCDLLGALAHSGEGSWALPCEPGGAAQRQLAVRFAVNIAMYVLCSNYKDDQVHAQALMRRRGGVRP